MSMTSVQLPDALQTLIDSRLDTIDRMLLGRVNRQDRMAIVKEVESQVFDLLRSAGDDLSRDDVLAVLARLDPPEAYLPDEDDAPVRRSLAAPRAVAPGRAGVPRLAKVAGIAGIVSLSLLMLGPLIFLSVELIGSEVFAYMVLFATVGMILTGGVVSIVLGATNRHRGAWPVIGITCGISALAGAVSLGGLFLCLG